MVRRKKPLISVIIPAFNEEECIGNLLSDLKKQTYKKFEVFVVDDRSTDDTVRIAKQAGVKVLISGKHNLSYSRNLGIENSKGNIIVNLDADYRVNESFLEGIVECFADPEVEGLRLREKLVQDTLLERLDFMRTFYRYGGYTISIRVFKRGATYDKDVPCFGEDILMSKKIKGKIVPCDKALLKHHRFHSFKELFISWKKYPTSFVYIKKYEGLKNMWKWFLPLSFPIISPLITLHRLIKFKDPRALLIPVYDFVRAVAYTHGMLIYLKDVGIAKKVQ